MLTPLFRTTLIGCLTLGWFTAGCQPEHSSAPVVQILPTPAPANSAQPHLARASDGTVVLSWQRRDGDNTALQFATFTGNDWSAARTAADGANWFVNWADFGSVVPLDRGHFAAHWLEKREGGAFAYDVAMAQSFDGGASWGQSVSPHDDGTATEHGFVSLYPAADGVGVLWLDGRSKTVPDHDAHHGGGDMTLRSATVTAGGQVVQPRIADRRVCDCCQTDIAYNGTQSIAVYRDRSDNETRDIFVSRLTKEGWTPGVSVADDDWVITGCPVNGPAIAAQGDTVVVAWFTGAQDTPRIRVARSNDGGRSFDRPVELDARRTRGRIDVVLLANGDAVVSSLFVEREEHGQWRLQRIGSQGQAGQIITVAQMPTARATGFGQMVRRDNDLLLAWTQIKPTAVKVAIIRNVASAF